MKAIRTQQVFIHDNGTVSRMCHTSKNLFNQVNYILRKQFINKEKMSSYKTLAKEFSKPSDIGDNNNFRKLPSIVMAYYNCIYIQISCIAYNSIGQLMHDIPYLPVPYCI